MRTSRTTGNAAVAASTSSDMYMLCVLLFGRRWYGARRRFFPYSAVSFFLSFRYVVGKPRHRAHTGSQREESGESQSLGSLWRATLSREAWMPIWGLSTESMKPWPPPGGGRGYGTKRRRWCGGTGVAVVFLFCFLLCRACVL